MAMGGGGKGGSSWGGSWRDAANKEWTNADWKVPGFAEALEEVIRPHLVSETDMSPDEIEIKIAQKIVKAAKKYNNDERRSQVGTPAKAQALIEEFVDTAMGAIAASLYDKPWFPKVNFTAPLLAIALHTFDGAKVFSRTLGPMIEKYVEEGIFKYNEEERIAKCISDAVDAAEVRDAYKKKAINHLGKAFDEAHFKSPYGTTPATSPEMGMIKDFVRGWMADFVGRAWDVMDNGIGQGVMGTSRDEKVLFVTVLFQSLTDQSNPALPADLTAAVADMPPSPWPYVAECAEAVFGDLDAQAKLSAANKKARLAMDAKDNFQQAVRGLIQKKSPGAAAQAQAMQPLQGWT